MQRFFTVSRMEFRSVHAKNRPTELRLRPKHSRCQQLGVLLGPLEKGWRSRRCWRGGLGFILGVGGGLNSNQWYFNQPWYSQIDTLGPLFLATSPKCDGRSFHTAFPNFGSSRGNNCNRAHALTYSTSNIVMLATPKSCLVAQSLPNPQGQGFSSLEAVIGLGWKQWVELRPC